MFALEGISRRRVMRFVVRALVAVSLLLTFVGALLGGAVLHLNLSQSRAAVARLISTLTSNELAGSIHVGEIERILPTGLRMREVRAYAPNGSEVVAVSELRVRVRPLSLATKLLFERGDLTLVFEHVRVESANVAIEENPETGLPRIAETFTPIASTTSSRRAEPRRFRVYLPSIEIGAARARVRLAGVPSLVGAVSRVRASLTADQSGAAVNVSRFGVQARENSGLVAHGTGSFRMRTPDRIWTSFQGHVGEVPIGARFGLRGHHIALTAETPYATPQQLRSLWAPWPVVVPLSGTIGLIGDLPRLQTKATVTLEGAGRVELSGPLDVDRIRTDLTLLTDSVSLRAFAQNAPGIRLSSTGGVTLTRHQSDWIADIALNTSPSVHDGKTIPSVETVAHLERGKLEGHAILREPGVPIRVAFQLAPEQPLELAFTLPWFRLSDVPRLRQLTAATGWLRGNVEVVVDSGRLVASGKLDTREFRFDRFALEHSSTDFGLEGPTGTPRAWRLKTNSRAKDVSYGELKAGNASLNTQGELLRPTFELALDDRKGAALKASAHADFTDEFELGALQLSLERDKQKLEAKVEKLRFSSDTVRLQGLALTQGTGSLSGEASLANEVVQLDLQAKSLNLATTAEVIGLPRGHLRGTLDLDAHLALGNKGQQQGTLQLRINDGSILGSKAMTATAEASLNGASFNGNLVGQLDETGLVSSQWNAELPGAAHQLETWIAATGDAMVEFNYLQLAALNSALPPEFGIERIDGQAHAQIRVERDSAERLPTVMFVGASKGLEIDLATANGLPGTAIRGLDLHIGGGLDNSNRRLHASVRVTDDGEQWVSASSSLVVPSEAQPPYVSDLLARLSDAPFESVMVLHERSVDDLPEWLPFTIPARRASGRLALNGSLKSCIATGQLEILGLQMPGSARAESVDLDIRATYDFQRKRWVGHAAGVTGGERVALLDLRSRPSESAKGSSDAKGRQTEANLALTGLPLTVFAPFAEADIGGRMHGKVTLQQDGDGTQVAANVKLKGIEVDLLPVGDARLTLRSDGRIANGRIRFTTGSGSLEARAIAPILWDSGLPALSREKEVTIAIDAEDYDAVILKPFVGDVFSELRGNVNADVSISLRNESPESDAKQGAGSDSKWLGSMKGTASLRDGVVQARALGLELKDVRFDLTAREQRKLTAVEIRGIQARARANAPNLRGEAILYFNGFDLLRANATANLSAFPLVLEGVTRATATGGVNLQLEAGDEHMDMVVSVPDLTAVMPRRAGHSVLDLDTPESIVVLQTLENPNKSGSSGSLRWRIQLELGDRVRIRRSDFNIPFSGSPIIELAEDLAVNGELRLTRGGRVVLLGRDFRIERGQIRFDTDDVTNPSIVIAAVWRGPTHRVTVNLSGTVQEAQMQLTSDPPLPETEVVALLLGGSPGDGGSATATGVGVGATLWNNVFADTALSAVDIRTSTEAERSNYTAAVRVSEEVWFEATYKSPAADAQSSPGASGSDPGFSGTLDWRFRPDWSLRTDVGTLGAGFDLLWQYRY